MAPPPGITDPAPGNNSATDTDNVLIPVTVTKTVTGAPATGAAGDYVFEIACANPVATYNGTITLAGTATSGSTSVAIPAGSSGCVVAETAVPVAPTGYTWGTASYTQPADPLPGGGTATAEIVNPLSANAGSITITKTLTGATSATDLSFPVTVDCATPTATYSGSITVAAGGTTGTTTIGGIPAGTTACQVTEGTRPAPPANYSWGTESYTQPAPAALPAGGSLSAEVVNPLQRNEVSVEVTKTVTGAPATGAAGDYVFEIACANPVATYNGTITLAGTATSGSTSVAIPAGSSGCVVAETAVPAAPTYHEWQAPSYSQLPATLPGSGTVAAGIVNPLDQVPPVISSSKSSNPASGSEVVPGDTITYTLSTTITVSALTETYTLTDTLSGDQGFGAVIDAGAYSCAGTGPLVCTLPAGTLPGTYALSYTATVDADASGSVGNTVVGVGGGDPDPECTSCTTTHPVVPLPIMANDDEFGPVNGYMGASSLGNAYDNDTLDGQPVSVDDITGTVLAPATPIDGAPVPVLDTATGVVGVPAGTPAGTYTIGYQICEQANPGNCDPASITVLVQPPPIDAVDDTATTPPSTPVTIDLFGNDTLNGAAIDASEVTLTEVQAPQAGALTIGGGGPTGVAIDGLVTYVPDDGFTGTDAFIYRICERLNPTNCDTATVTITVEGVTAVRLTKQASPRDVRVGDLVRYTLVAENIGQVAVVDGTLVDTPPAGFSYVDGSLGVADADGAGRLVGTYPIRVDQIDIPVGGRATITYLLRVGSGVRAGMHTNTAQVEDNGEPVSNVATASVQMVGNPLFDDSTIMGTVFDDQDGDGWQDDGERGVPGVRIASVEGLLVETDQFGRYHLVGIDGGRWERGRNFILKVDPATLPPGSTFTTDNPLLRRITPGLPVRFDFGVKLPPGLVEGGEQQVEIELGEVLFHAESAELRPEYLPVIEKMGGQVREHGGGEVVIVANGETQALAYDRARVVQSALNAELGPELAQQVQVTLRTDRDDPDSRVVSLGEMPVLGTVLFDTDESTIRPEFEPLLDRVAAGIAQRGGGVIGVVGHADKRGSDAYNVALGLRRAHAVYEAIASRLPPEVRSRLRVDISDNPTAPVGSDAREGG